MMKQFLDNSYLFGGNAPFIEDLYEKYLVNPASVPDEWREYFDRMQMLPGSATKDVARAPVEESFVQRAKKGEFSNQRTLPVEPVAPERLQVAALLLVTAYRISGSRWRRSRSRTTTSFPQALSERRLLLRHRAARARHPGGDVHLHLLARAHSRLDRPVAGDDLRPGVQDRPSAPALQGRDPQGREAPRQEVNS